MEIMNQKESDEQAQEEVIKKAMERFGALIREDFKRIETIKNAPARKDFKKLSHITVGILPGDGIGPYIMEQALRVAKYLLKDEMASGKVEFRTIPGMTIEERAQKNESLPAEVLEACKACDVLVKGPFVTPRSGDPWPNMVSANSLLRRALQLYAAVRPVRIPEKGIDWTFFRENIEGEYIWGNKGIQVDDDLAVDFKVLTRPGAERICRAAFEFAKNNGKTNVTVVTKANIVKLVDGNFLKTAHALEKEYPGITVREELVDSMAAKITDQEFTKGMQVFLLPNLYGDIVTDVAAEYQGGLGTASSSNIGDQYALFEAIHGVGNFLVQHNRAQYADPCSLIRAMGEMISHIGYPEKKEQLVKALDICTRTERKVVITTDKDGATAEEFTDYLLDTLQREA
ncbi:isocitrate dehydrogenase (NAD+) [Acidaminococcus fermentans]|nr:isocitrate/isopropylmalate family dehydrogenase [Acidaminococcus fermentans]MCI6285880.1 isocitrate/isopropylmalate family dehydrogenase [Acidaminococcus fermentans]MDD7194898.1 isocitrate/isopropylmalate family dehydrogenase [Acidaminococcus fermentans]MDY2852301.1 isocitrate/isopropylmalate family dehydrogenase [Acidaminococcus fermentans]MDY4147244.1 isocitrate/isopropylmalate family dehydrogenase [Acidaminococcus fermentans]SFO73028.1 isocitrate dehydrogenase (NAD+) [Acidaminococcus fer